MEGLVAAFAPVATLPALRHLRVRVRGGLGSESELQVRAAQALDPVLTLDPAADRLAIGAARQHVRRCVACHARAAGCRCPRRAGCSRSTRATVSIL